MKGKRRASGRRWVACITLSALAAAVVLLLKLQSARLTGAAPVTLDGGAVASSSGIGHGHQNSGASSYLAKLGATPATINHHLPSSPLRAANRFMTPASVAATADADAAPPVNSMPQLHEMQNDFTPVSSGSGMPNPAIIVFCFNRPRYLNHSLHSLASLKGLEGFTLYIAQVMRGTGEQAWGEMG